MFVLFGGDGTHCFAKKTSHDYEGEKKLRFSGKFSANPNQADRNLSQERQKSFRLWHNCVDNPVVDTDDQILISILFLYTFSLQKSNMIFSVSNDGIVWSLDSGPDSVTLTVKDLVPEMTITS